MKDFANRSIRYILATSLGLLVTYYVYKSLTNHWLWYDEAGQFWISMGLNHYSLPLSVPGGFVDVIVNNRLYNMDPGGFSILLHFWIKISTSDVFLRLFPLLFFLGFVFFLYLIISSATRNKYYAFIISLMVFLWHPSYIMMTEIRAYSMELLGITIALWLYLKLTLSYSTRHLVLLSLTLCLFSSSRYEYVIFASCLICLVLYRIYSTNICVVRRSCLLILPFCFTVIAIYMFSMRYQNPVADKMNYVSYLCDSKAMFRQPLFLLYLVNAVWVLAMLLKKHKLTLLQVVSLFVPTIFVLLSLIGLYPWDELKTISVPVILMMSLAVEVYSLNEKNQFFSLAIMFLVMVRSLPNIGTRFDKEWETVQTFKEKVVSVDRSYVDFWFSPSIRYLYEYGTFSNTSYNDGYPHKMIFGKGAQHKDTQTVKNTEQKSQGKTEIRNICDLYLVRSEWTNTSTLELIGSSGMLFQRQKDR